MIEESRLDRQVRRLTFLSAIAAIISMLVSFGLPLDAPQGYEATAEERVSWLLSHRGVFVSAWINQIIAMVSLTTTFAGFTWLVRNASPLLAIVHGALLFSSFIVFMIPKFIAIWTIPLLAQATSDNNHLSAMAAALLPMLNVSVPFSLFTAFDYLGFWLYAVFALLIAPPLLSQGPLGKVCGLSFGLYGLSYHGIGIGILLARISGPYVEGYAVSISLLLVIPVFLALVMFRKPASIGNA